jgi:hypothetical protein
LSRSCAVGDRGATLIEYMLLVALVAMASAGALAYLGGMTASPSHVADKVAVGVAGGTGLAGTTLPHAPFPTTTWCDSSAIGCTDTVRISGHQTITFWATGGTPPYKEVLNGNPTFVTLQHVDSAGARGQLSIDPTNCNQAGAYEIELAVSELTGTAATGYLDFSLSVPSCTG